MAANMPPMLLAYAPADHFAAETLRKAAEDRGLGVEVAPQDAGAQSAIAASASVARVLVIVHSRATVADLGVQRVAEAAGARKLPTLVVRLDDAKPSSAMRRLLRGAASIDATSGKLPQRVEGIVARARHAAGLSAGADVPTADAPGIDPWGPERRQVPRSVVAALVVVLAVLAVLAWRAYDRSSAQAAYDRGIARIAQGDLEQAGTDLDAALQRRPDWAAAWRQRGFAARDPAAQVRYFTRAIELDPADADALAARGRAFFAAGDAARARNDMGAALDLVPANAEWRGERGLFAIAAGDDAAARADFRECQRIDARCADAFASRIAALESAQGRPPVDWFANP